MGLGALTAEVDRITREIEQGRLDPGAVPGLHLIRRTAPSSSEASVYDPIACLILQGRKETTVGEQRFSAGPGSCVIVSHDLPVVARIQEASPAAPYLAVVARLDLAELRGIYDEVGDDAPSVPGSAYALGPVDPALVDVLRRAVAAIEDPVGVRVLAPLLRRELHYRLLVTGHGAMLRTMLRRDSHASHVARAIQRVRRDFRYPLKIPELARSVGMSTSAFHKHFKQITATTPLQYQKELRLTEARRLLAGGAHSVSSAAFEVGYESPTQFSREYARKFGERPQEDLRRARRSAPARAREL